MAETDAARAAGPVGDEDRGGRYSINAVANALALMAALAEHESLSLADAALVTGVSRSTAYRLLVTLEEARLAERMASGGYRAGSGD